MTVDRNSLDYWFPPLALYGGIPVPKTEIVYAHNLPLMNLLDGVPVPGFDGFVAALQRACYTIAGEPPAFLRTGHTSGKHEWDSTAYLPDFEEETIGNHVAALVEESALADLMGLPTDVWAVREYLDVEPLFRCVRFGNMPVVTEFRVFIRGDEIEHVQPYWPLGALEQGEPDVEDWRERVAHSRSLMHSFAGPDGEDVWTMSGEAAGLLARRYGDDRMFWSMDWLLDRHGKWWLTDMAEGDRSFRYDPKEEE